MITGLTHTLLIILITLAISFIAWQQRNVMNRLIFNVSAIKHGQYDRFLTHGFIHKDGMHLFFNMFTLYFFGRNVEWFFRDYLSGMGFVLFYCSAIIIAAIPSYLHNRTLNSYRSLGASGAVSAVLFAYILFQPWKLIFVFFIPVPAIIFAVLYVAYSIWSGKRGNSNVYHSAHLWGAAYGAIVTIIIQPKILPHFLQQLSQFPF